MLTLGIDDAGRGPVIGPMVLAGCLVDEKAEKELKKLGVKDSKQLTQKRREVLAEKIKEKAETFEIIVIPPSIINGDGEQFCDIGSKLKRAELEAERFHESASQLKRVKSGVGNRTKLNEIEAEACAEIINRINKGFKKIKVIIDCPSPNLTKWTDFLKTKIEDLSNLEISCEHKADKNHVSVSAASILAKNIREKEMNLLRKKYGNGIGSGYCSDPLTQEFLQKNIKKYKDDGIFRKTWKTWSIASGKAEQKKLF